MQTLNLGRMAFEVEQVETSKLYLLRGKRGAMYGTMRNRKHPELLFVYNLYRTGKTPFDGVWLTDKNGKLEIAGGR